MNSDVSEGKRAGIGVPFTMTSAWSLSSFPSRLEAGAMPDLPAGIRPARKWIGNDALVTQRKEGVPHSTGLHARNLMPRNSRRSVMVRFREKCGDFP